ncbi:MAG: asparagine synthase (glutamine-hydrolyzing) [Nitrospirota bacterium]
MCGIAGIYNLNNEPVSQDTLKRMCDVIRHRGPDDEGQWLDGNIGFGHRRLSIIDLSTAGHQPMSNEDGTIWITYNGEVYNYVELRPELEAKGHRFISHTDTEVIIHAYEEYGEECLSKFNGMFAFALWDSRQNKLFCARDRFGIKPFYYYYDSQRFVFASEIKSLLEDEGIEKRPNNQIICDYLIYAYIDHTEDTFFEGIKQLPPAHYLVIKDGKVSIKRYWDINPDEKLQSNSIDDTKCAQRFYELFEDSIRLRLRSDVPVGTCLSGGLDSSSIVCVVNKLLSRNLQNPQQKSFSSCFEDKTYDEREFIQEVVNKTRVDANFTFPDGNKLFDIIPDVIWHQDEPFGSTSIFAQWHVMKLAKEKGVTVLLDGQGADELLAGYHPYYHYYFSDLIRTLQFKKLIEELNLYFKYHSYPKLDTLLKLIQPLLSYGLRNSLKSILKMKMSNWVNTDFAKIYQRRIVPGQKYKGCLEDRLYQDITNSSLPALLRYEDRNSMAHSVEARVPFLDYRLVEFVFSLPSSQKIRDGITKILLRNATKGILPEKVRMRMDKMGFVTPGDVWFRTVAKDKILEIFNSDSFKSRGYFNIDEIKREFDAHCRGEKNLHFTVWRWINLELWLQRFFD